MLFASAWEYGSDDEAMSVKHPHVTAIALIGMVACARPSLRPELFVPSDAQQIHVDKNYNGGVSYQVLRPYPADAFILQLNGHFGAYGFHPVTPDIFGQETSLTRGVGDYIDGLRKPETHVAQWSGDWENAAGDRIVAFLRYRTAVNKGPETTAGLDASELYMSKTTVARMRDAVAKKP